MRAAVTIVVVLAGCGGRTGLNEGVADADIQSADADVTQDGADSGAEASPPCTGPSGLVTLATNQDAPAAIVLDSTYVYFANAGVTADAGSIVRVPKCGGPAATLVAGGNPAGVAVSSTAVYWSTSSLRAVGSGAVLTAPLSGGMPTTLAAHQDGPGAMLLRGGDLYWANSVGGQIVDLPAGGRPVTLASGLGSLSIAYSGPYIYWPDVNGVKRVPLGGGDVSTVVTGLASFIAVDSTHLYWTDLQGSVFLANLAGGAVTTIASGQATPSGITIDSEHVYWVNLGTRPFSYKDGSVVRANLDGGGVTTLAGAQDSPFQIAVDDASVYWVNSAIAADGGSVMKLTPK